MREAFTLTTTHFLAHLSKAQQRRVIRAAWIAMALDEPDDAMPADVNKCARLRELLREAVPLAAFAQDSPKYEEQAREWHHNVAVALDEGVQSDG